MGKFFLKVDKDSRNMHYKLYVHKIGFFRFNWHKEIEINIVLRGKVEVCCEGKKYLLSEDDSIIINSNSGHATLAKEPDSIAMVLHLDPIYFKEYFKEYDSLRFHEVSNIRNDSRYDMIKYLSAVLLNKHKKRNEKDEVLMDAIFSSLTLNILRTFENSIEKQNKTNNSKSQMKAIAKVLKYIEEAHRKKISLNDIAHILGYNVNYVSQFFKSSIGINFYEYLTRVRIREATFELVNTNNNISDIVLEHGFPDIKSFNKAFKESFGRTPKEYRAEIQQNADMNYSFLRRVFIEDDDEYVNEKIREYMSLVEDKVLLAGDDSKRELGNKDKKITRYCREIEDLEKKVMELNRKINLIKGILA